MPKPLTSPSTPGYAPRLGHAKALVAVEHSIVVAIFHMVDRDQRYHDLGVDYFIP